MNLTDERVLELDKIKMKTKSTQDWAGTKNHAVMSRDPIIKAINRINGKLNGVAIYHARLREQNRVLREVLENTLRYLVTPSGFPDKKHRTTTQQQTFDSAIAALAATKEGE